MVIWLDNLIIIVNCEKLIVASLFLFSILINIKSGGIYEF